MHTSLCIHITPTHSSKSRKRSRNSSKLCIAFLGGCTGHISIFAPAQPQNVARQQCAHNTLSSPIHWFPLKFLHVAYNRIELFLDRPCIDFQAWRVCTWCLIGFDHERKWRQWRRWPDGRTHAEPVLWQRHSWRRFISFVSVHKNAKKRLASLHMNHNASNTRFWSEIWSRVIFFFFMSKNPVTWTPAVHSGLSLFNQCSVWYTLLRCLYFTFWGSQEQVSFAV